MPSFARWRSCDSEAMKNSFTSAEARTEQSTSKSTLAINARSKPAAELYFTLHHRFVGGRSEIYRPVESHLIDTFVDS
jgi:hypothetical protein